MDSYTCLARQELVDTVIGVLLLLKSNHQPTVIDNINTLFINEKLAPALERYTGRDIANTVHQYHLRQLNEDLEEIPYISNLKRERMLKLLHIVTRLNLLSTEHGWSSVALTNRDIDQILTIWLI